MNYDAMPELSPAAYREFVMFAYRELRRLRIPEQVRPSEPVVYRPARLVVRPQPMAQATMSLPPCLCMPDTQAGIERRFSLARNMLTQGA